MGGYRRTIRCLIERQLNGGGSSTIKVQLTFNMLISRSVLLNYLSFDNTLEQTLQPIKIVVIKTNLDLTTRT